MKTNKNVIIKRFMSFAVMIVMVFSMSFAALAAEDEEENKPAGTPVISVISGNAYEIDPGTENKVAIRIRNTSTNMAKSIVVIPSAEDMSDNPLTVSVDGPTSNIGSLSANGERTINLIVKCDRTAATKTYGVNLKFTFLNTDGVDFSSTSEIYFKIKNVSSVPVFSFENFKLNPDAISAGDSADFSFDIVNRGPLNMYDAIISIEELDPSLVGISGTNQKKFTKIWAGTRESLNFRLTTNSSMEDGSYPVTIKAAYKDENGKDLTYEEKYYIAVGAGSGKNADIRIENMKEPSGVYGVNQNFNISFTVKNYGDGTAENLKISAAEYGEGGNVVPKSTSTFSLKELAPQESKDYSFTFAPTGNASSRNYTVELLVSYKMGGKEYSVSQYAGANVSNPDKDDEDGDKKESKPKIIVSEYKCDPVIVMAGQNFDLTMTFLNTHYQKAVKNIKMYLTMVEETASENDKSGNVFTPVNSSNTFYYDSIPAKGTVEKTMTLYTVPSAQPKTYTLTVNFEYEDESGNEYTATELLGINVKQVSQVDTSEIFVPESSEIGMPISLYFDIYNTGKVDVSNLKVSLEGDIDTQNKSTYIGNCAPGDSNYYEGSFSVSNMGINTVKIVMTYDDPSGEEIRQEKEYTINGIEPMVYDEPMDTMDMPEENGMGQGLGTGTKIALVIGFIIAVCAAIIVPRIIKKKKATRLLEDDDSEGTDENEQL